MRLNPHKYTNICTHHFQAYLKNKQTNYLGARVMALQIGAHTALAEDPGFVPSAHNRWLITA